MVAVTVSGSLNGTSVAIPTNSALQTALFQQLLASATAAGSVSNTAGGVTTLTSGVLSDFANGGIISGTASVPSAIIGLGLGGSQNQIYVTNGTAVSTVVTADNSNSSIVNNNPFGAIVAQTGAGGNVLLGLAGQNNFFTGNGGSDVVVLNGVANNLTSRGADAVLVGGPSTVFASAGGTDNVLMTAGTQLAFINGSRMPDTDTVTGAAGATVVLAGTGNTSVAAGAGTETFFIDTSAGNTTLTGNTAGSDAFTFIKGANTGGATVAVNNFVSNDILQVHGYAGFNVTAGTAGSVLALSDGSQITFSNVSVATVQQAVKVV